MRLSWPGLTQQCPAGGPQGGAGMSQPPPQPELESEVDESEIRRELLNDKWRQLFDKYDPEGFGEIPWDDFLEVLNNPEFIAEVDSNKRDILRERAQERTTSAITFQDFVNVHRGRKKQELTNRGLDRQVTSVQHPNNKTSCV
ncbi:hypothetical protein L9F63_004141, partial [Diploptera punctata]